MRLFEKYYKLPLSEASMYVPTADGKNAFNWLIDDNELEAKVIESINTGANLTEGLNLTVDPGNPNLILNNSNPFILIRGWEMLTGVGGYNLSAADAIKVQDDFRDYIIETIDSGAKQKYLTSVQTTRTGYVIAKNVGDNGAVSYQTEGFCLDPDEIAWSPEFSVHTIMWGTPVAAKIEIETRGIEDAFIVEATQTIQLDIKKINMDEI